MLGVLVVATALVALRLTAVSKKARQAPRLLGTAVTCITYWTALACMIIREKVCCVTRAAIIMPSALCLLNKYSICARPTPWSAGFPPEEISSIARTAVVVLGAQLLRLNELPVGARAFVRQA